MIGRIFSWLFLGGLFFCFGCPPSPEQTAYSEIQGLKLSDLQAVQTEQVESLLSFSVLTYSLDANSIDALRGVADLLSNKDIRYDNAAAFLANGFLVGAGLHQEGDAVAQKLRSIGAVRLSQGNLTLPSGSAEILYWVDVDDPRAIVYSVSATELMDVTVGGGRMGWVIWPQQDPTDKKLVHITLAPAFWRTVASDLRLLEGKEPYQFHFFDAGRVHIPIKAGQLFLLAPRRGVQDQDTLNRVLFEMPRGKKVRFFVIICGTVRD